MADEHPLIPPDREENESVTRGVKTEDKLLCRICFEDDNEEPLSNLLISPCE